MQCVRLEVTHDWSAAARFKFSTSGMVTKNSARLFSASALQRRRIDFIQKGACHVIASNVFAMLAEPKIVHVFSAPLHCNVVELTSFKRARAM